MVFKQGEYSLYCSEVRLRVGKKPGKPRMNYFFSQRTPIKGTPCDLPIGYEVNLNKKTGMPYLKYSKGRKSTWKRE